MAKIVISEKIHENAVAILAKEHDVIHDPSLVNNSEKFALALKDADALIIRNATQIKGDILNALDTVRVIGRHGVGLDNMDVAALKAKDITITWAPGTNAVSVAEYVLGAMLHFSRNFAANSNDVHAGNWNRVSSIGTELFGKTLGIIGLGDIGSRVAKRARAFNMSLIAYSPSLHHNHFAVQEYGVTPTTLEDLFKQSDFISLHAPLVPTTENIINENSLDLMKSNAYLINTARGGLVAELALAKAIQSGQIAGAALDVRKHEPPQQPDPLANIDNVLLTPHMGGMTDGSSYRTDVLRVLNGKKPISEVKG